MTWEMQGGEDSSQDASVDGDRHHLPAPGGRAQLVCGSLLHGREESL